MTSRPSLVLSLIMCERVMVGSLWVSVSSTTVLVGMLMVMSAGVKGDFEE